MAAQIKPRIHQALHRGLVVPACPLALNARRELDEPRQRALFRYYLAAGAGGLAVGVHTTQFAIREPKIGLFRPVLELAAAEMACADADGNALARIAGVCGVTKQAVAEGKTPVVLADHSDRSGSATWLLQEIIAQGLSHTLIATIADATTTAKLKALGAKAGDAFDMEIGGLVDESAGDPVRIQGTILKVVEAHGQFWVCVKFGRNNVLILSTYLVQIMEPSALEPLVPDIDAFKVMAIKSRVHFRRGFHDNGFAKTILLVEPSEPFLGTTRLDALPYRNVDLKQFYPYGNPAFPA